MEDRQHLGVVAGVEAVLDGVDGVAELLGVLGVQDRVDVVLDSLAVEGDVAGAEDGRVVEGGEEEVGDAGPLGHDHVQHGVGEAADA